MVINHQRLTFLLKWSAICDPGCVQNETMFRRLTVEFLATFDLVFCRAEADIRRVFSAPGAVKWETRHRASCEK